MFPGNSCCLWAVDAKAYSYCTLPDGNHVYFEVRVYSNKSEAEIYRMIIRVRVYWSHRGCDRKGEAFVEAATNNCSMI